MRNENEVRRKLDELLKRWFDEFRDEYLSQVPRNCVFNTRFRVKGQGQIGFCQNPAVLNTLGMKVFVCHEPDAAKQCRVFRCRNTEESIRQDFNAILRSPERCGEKFPQLATLIWVVQEYVARTRANRLRQAFGNMSKTIWNLITFKWW
jgi:hypothetical protein